MKNVCSCKHSSYRFIPQGGGVSQRTELTAGVNTNYSQLKAWRRKKQQIGTQSLWNASSFSRALKISAGSSGMFLLRHLPPSLFSLRMFSLLSVEKILMSVSLVRKSTCPTHTEQNWADLTAAPHGPPRSHLYSQAKAKHCETTQTVFSSV